VLLNGRDPARFTNSGTFRKVGATGITEIGIPFNNNGTVDVDSGVVRVIGTYVSSDSAALNVAIGGQAAGAQFGQLAVIGDATLAGALNVSWANGYVPNVGDSFRVVTFDSGTGSFTSPSGLDLGNGRYFTVNLDSSGLRLVVAQAAPTATAPPTNTPLASVTVTPTPVPTVTPIGTNTPPSTVTPSATPSATATATPTTTATASVTATSA
jgi:hypothetical protein